MEVITIESQAFKKLQSNISTIAKFVAALQAKAEEEPEDGWVDSYEVCTFLKISSKTLQRLRQSNSINFSRIRGKHFYRISEIQRVLNDMLKKNGNWSCIMKLYAINNLVTDNDYMCSEMILWIKSLILKSILISGHSAQSERLRFFDLLKDKIQRALGTAIVSVCKRRIKAVCSVVY